MTRTPIAAEIPLATWTRAVKKSALQQMLMETSRPGIISFALGLPDVSLFPTDVYRRTREFQKGQSHYEE